MTCSVVYFLLLVFYLFIKISVKSTLSRVAVFFVHFGHYLLHQFFFLVTSLGVGRVPVLCIPCTFGLGKLIVHHQPRHFG